MAEVGGGLLLVVCLCFVGYILPYEARFALLGAIIGSLVVLISLKTSFKAPMLPSFLWLGAAGGEGATTTTVNRTSRHHSRTSNDDGAAGPGQDGVDGQGDSDGSGDNGCLTDETTRIEMDQRYRGVKLIDWNGSQFPFNEIVDFENEFFEGQVLFMVKVTPEDPRYAAHFAGKQRLFEMQIQGKFKKLPAGILYMGAELTEKMQMGLVTKTVAGMILAFGKRVLKNLHYSFGESIKTGNADEIELPHVTFPLSRGMDRLIITPPGGSPPPLGREFMEPDDLRIGRRNGKGEEPQFVLDSIYSMSFHSMYMDFPRWQLVNIAGQKSIDFSSLLGEASIHIVVYDLDPTIAVQRHRKCDKRYFYHCELVNSCLGQDVDALLEKAEAGEANGGGGRTSIGGTGGGGGMGDESETGGDDRELLGSVFVRSGDVVPLLASTVGKNGQGWACISENKGFCIVRPGAASIDVLMIKVGGTSAYYRSDFLCNGDVIILRNSMNGKYLSVYKGWWLYWTSNPPSSSSSRAHFVIQGMDEAERLTVGRPFTLRSNKWSTYAVGINDSLSSEYGGRLLGLYQTSKSKKMFQSKKSKTWLVPVQLKVQFPRDEASLAAAGAGGASDEGGGNGERGSGVSPSRAKEREELEKMEGLDPFVDSTVVNITSQDVEEDMEVDVPAWIEMVHRRRRKPQLAYALRVRFRGKPDVCCWMALRTGMDLAPVIQMQRDRNADGAGMEKDDLSKSSQQYILQQDKKSGHKRGRNGGSGGDAFPPGMPRPLQHQNPADQSVRLLTQLLDEITSYRSEPWSNEPHPLPPSCKAALYSLLKRKNYLDVWFLNGTAADMAVAVPARPASLLQSMVARALWESHWKEEWMVLYATHVSFSSSGAKKASWSLFLHDILAVKIPTGKIRLYFPGRHFLSIETLGRVHYLCFGSESLRDTWLTSLSGRVGQAGGDIPAGVVTSDPREAFVLKSGQWRPSSRIILNARRMAFDVSPPTGTPSQISERALRLVYDLSPDSGTERLVSFLDFCSSFRSFSLHLLDPASEEALAFFLNIYHALLQHALLLLGPPSSKDWSTFYSSVSYEIGADVFSLTEIEHCVIRGKLSRPRTVPRYMPSPPHPEDDHYRFAVAKADYRVNFALTSGSLSGPPFVTIFRADNLSDQLDNASVRFVDYTLKLDTRKRMVILPKVCDIYRADFGESESSLDVVKICVRFLDRIKWERVSWALAGAKAPVIKYMAAKIKCHESLCLIEDRNNSL